MKSAPFWIVLAACATARPVVSEAAPARADYLVTWRANEFPKAQVTARLRSATCTFRMSDRWATFFEGDKRGWSRFVTDLRAVRDGRPASATATPEGAWVVGAAKPCTVELRYTIDFSFGKQQWSAGNEQVAYVDDRAVYTTGIPLFVLGDDEAARVRFDVPRDWIVSVPWRADGANAFMVARREALIGNTIVVGRHAAATFTAQQLNVTAVLLGDYAASKTLLVTAFTKLVPLMTSWFGDRDPGNYMFTVMPGPEDGEAFEDSFAVATPAAPVEANKVIWANNLAHELLHYWMGHKLAPSDAERDELQWFTEGVTEYLANTALLETQVYDDQTYRDRIGRHLGAYMLTRSNPNFNKVSPKAAGKEKWKNRPLVYSGGASIGFCLDAMIRAASNSQRGLPDVTRALYARRAKEPNLTGAAIREEVARAVGKDMTEFFTKYVDGTDDLPIEDCARKRGMRALIQNHDVFLLR